MRKIMSMILCAIMILTCLIGCAEEPEEVVIERDPGALIVYMFGDCTISSDEMIYQTVYTLGEFKDRPLFWGKEAHMYYEPIQKYMEQTDRKVEVTYFSNTKEILEQLKKDVETGNLPDVMIGSYASENYDLYSMIEDGFFYDMKEFFDQDGIYSGGEYLSTILKAGEIKGKQMIFPLSFNMNILMTSNEQIKAKRLSQFEGASYDEMVRYFTEEWQNEERDQDEVLLMQFSDMWNTFPYWLFEAASGISYYDSDSGRVLPDQTQLNQLANLYEAYLCNDFNKSREELKELAKLHNEYLVADDDSKKTRLDSIIVEAMTEGFEFLHEDVGYVADGGLATFTLHSFAAQAAYYESRFSDANEEFVCIGIPMKNNPNAYSANVTTFGAILDTSEHKQESYELIKALADSPRHIFYDLSVNREQIEKSFTQMTSTTTEFYPMQGTFPPEMVPEGEDWLGSPYVIKPMSEATKDQLMDMIGRIGCGLLPDQETRTIMLNEIQQYIWGDTDTLNAAYEKAIEMLEPK